MRRRLQRRSQLVAARTRAKNEIHAALMRQLVGRAPFTDLFGKKGRRWLAELGLARSSANRSTRRFARSSSSTRRSPAVERLIAAEALGWPEVRRLMTVPGVNVICAATFMATIGDVAALRRRDSQSVISAATRGSASRGRPGDPRADLKAGLAAPATRWSRRAGRRSASPVRSAPSISG